MLFLPLTQASLEINEVMYAPTSAYGGSSNEWVELYNDDAQPYNTSSCFLDGRLVGDFIIEPYNYFVIANRLDLFNATYPNITAIDSVLSFRNDADIINLNCSDANTSFSYTSDRGALSNNKTLERNFELEWGQSKADGGTPGAENSIHNISFQDLTFVISEVLANPWENDDATAPDGEWIELLNYGEREIYAGGLKITDAHGENELWIAESSIAGDIFVLPGEYLVVYRDGDSDFSLNNNGYEEVRLVQETEDLDILIDFFSYTSTTEGMSWSNVGGEWYETTPTPMDDNEYTGECIWGLFIDTNNSIYRPEDFSFGINVDRFAGLADEITVRGQIEDEHGEMVRAYAPWSNVTVTSDRRQRYTPNLPAGIYQLSFWFENPPCLDIDPAAYRVTKLIAISPSYQRYDAALTINELNLGSDQKVKWGQQFTAKFTAYRSNGTQSTIEIWAEKAGKAVSPKTKVNAPARFTEYSFTVPLQLIPNCDEEISSGMALLHIEGLGKTATQEFKIEGVDTKVCTDYLDYIDEQEKSTSKLSYLVLDVPASVAPGEAFKIKGKIENDAKKHTFRTWAYVYRGNKCYSCNEGIEERDADAEELVLIGNKEKEMDLLLKLDKEMEEGEYKIKVLFNKDNQKTNKEVVETIYVQVPAETGMVNDSMSVFADGDQRSEDFSSLRSRITGASSGIVVYESNAEKSKKVIPYLLLVAGVLMVVVMWRKT